MTIMKSDTSHVSIAENLQELIDAKADIKSAIESKGVEVTGGLTTYADAIREIETGGGYGSDIDYTLIGWTQENSDKQNEMNSKFLNDDIKYSQYVRDLYNYVNNNGEIGYQQVFTNDKQLVIAPKVKLYPGFGASGFSECTALRYVPLYDTSHCTSMYHMFNCCVALEYIPQFDTSNVITMSHMLHNCVGLKYVSLLDCGNVKTFLIFGIDSGSQRFNVDYVEGFKDLGKSITEDYIGAVAYKNVSFTNVSLNVESKRNIINNLYDISTQGKSLTLQMDVFDLSDEDIAIATNKGWTVSV